MKTRLTLPVQWSVSLCIGLILGFLLQPVKQALPPVEPTPTNSSGLSTPPTAAPFVTMSGGWMVRIQFYRTMPPKIIKVLRLDHARLTSFPIGEYQIQISNSVGEAFYSQAFAVEFLSGDPPRPVDEKVMVFVLPAIEDGTQIIISTPNGNTKYDLPE